jgi:hypothetical protein
MKKTFLTALLSVFLGQGLVACACHKHRCCNKPAASAEGGCHKPCKKEGQAPCHGEKNAEEAQTTENK